MTQVLYASFNDASQSEQAAGALLDYGVRKEDLSLVKNDSTHSTYNNQNITHNSDITGREVAYSSGDAQRYAQEGGRESSSGGTAVLDREDYNPSILSGNHYASHVTGTGYSSTETEVLPEPGITNDPIFGSTYTPVGAVGKYNEYDANPNRDPSSNDKHYNDIDHQAKEGISVTTPGDAAEGATTGAAIGLGLGVLAGLASLAVPGFGLVYGGGALATALAAVAGTTVAGAAAGGLTGYLKDQGVPDDVVTQLDSTIRNGGAALSVNVPSNSVDLVTAEQVLRKYGATSVSAHPMPQGK